jgi:hypothetical protein
LSTPSLLPASQDGQNQLHTCDTERRTTERGKESEHIPVVVTEGVGVEANEDDSKKVWAYSTYILSQSE